MPDESKVTHDYAADLELLERMFGDDFDWNAWWNPPEGIEGDAPEEVFRRVYRWYDYREGERPVGTLECGGHQFRPSAPALYRALFLLEPSTTDFSDMYKSGSLIDCVSPDGQFHLSVQLWKYEMSVRFACSREHHVAECRIVMAGMPGSDNGTSCSSELGNKWFAVAVQAIERPWSMYSGNDFVV